MLLQEVIRLRICSTFNVFETFNATMMIIPVCGLRKSIKFYEKQGFSTGCFMWKYKSDFWNFSVIQTKNIFHWSKYPYEHDI